MNLTRWEPFYAMDKMFNRLPGFFGYGPRLGTAEYRDFDWSPSVDISETDKEYLIRAALPAVKKEDVKVTYEEAISAEAKEGVLTVHVPKTKVEVKKLATIKVQ